MRIVLSTCMSIPHAGGASTHFELLCRSLDTASIFAGRIVGQDCLPSRARRVILALWAFGDKDQRRLALLHETTSLLTKAIDKLVASCSPSLIHSHDALATYAAVNAPSMRERAIPVIQTVHGPWSREALTSGAGQDSLFFQKLRQIEESAFAKCSGFIAVDQGQADILATDFGVPWERISVVHNAVDCAEISYLSKQPADRHVPGPYFIVPRRLVPRMVSTLRLRL